MAVNDAVVAELGKLTTFAIESRHKSLPSIVSAALAEYADFAATLDRFADMRQGFGEDLTGAVESYLERLPAIMEALRVR